MGTPAQRFLACCDTGSADLWCASSLESALTPADLSSLRLRPHSLVLTDALRRAGCPQWTASRAPAARTGALTSTPAARSRCAALCVLRTRLPAQQRVPRSVLTQAAPHLQGSVDRFTIKYGTGTVAGRLVRDTLTLAEPPLQLPGQQFGLATEESPDFDAASCDGILVRPPAALSIAFRSVYHLKEYACVCDAQ